MFPTRKPLSSALESIQLFMAQVKSEAVQMKASSVAGPVGANQVIDYVGQLAGHKEQLLLLASTPGLAAYAQSQYAAPGLDIAAEFAATIAQIDATRLWITTNLPTSGGYLLEKSFDGNGRSILRAFTPAELAGFRTQLDALIATID